MKAKTLWLIGTLGIALAPGLALAQGDIDGKWRIDISKARFSGNPEVFVLKNGEYQCKSCAPLIVVRADGADHGISGSPYFDTVNFKIVDDHSVEETRKKNGKTVLSLKIVVSSDGDTATFEYSDSSRANATIVGSGNVTRVGKAKRSTGMHILSGTWQISKYANLSEDALTFTFELEGDNLRWSSPMGQSYVANVNGTDAPYQDDPGVTSVSVLRLGNDTYMETEKRDGKPIRVRRFMVNPNGAKDMDIIDSDNLTGMTVVLKASKQ